MTTQEIRKLIAEYDCEDCPTERIESHYFADEVIMTYEWDEEYSIEYRFIGCYKADFEHVKNYNKLRAVREMTWPQRPYFMQKIELGEIEEEGVSFFTFNVNTFPLYLEIWCQDVQIEKVPRWWKSEWADETAVVVQNKWKDNK